VAHYGLDKQPFLDLIAANEQDQRVLTYENWPQLEEYCRLSAAPVGRVVLRFFDIANAVTEKLSDDVCIGLQLANHAQDVSRDAKIGRSYLLQEDVRATGTRGAVRALVARARTLLASGKTLEAMAPGALRLQLALYRLGGLAICDGIEQLGYATEVTRPSVSKRAKVGILVRAVLEAAHGGAEVRNVETA
jgi:phytoene/squalene synthetase